MNQPNDESRIKQILGQPWAKALIGAGAVGAVALVIGVILRTRKLKKEQADALTLIAKDAEKVTGEAPLIVEAAESTAAIVGSDETAQAADSVAKHVPDEVTAERAQAFSASAKTLKKKR